MPTRSLSPHLRPFGPHTPIPKWKLSTPGPAVPQTFLVTNQNLPSVTIIWHDLWTMYILLTNTNMKGTLEHLEKVWCYRGQRWAIIKVWPKKNLAPQLQEMDCLPSIKKVGIENGDSLPSTTNTYLNIICVTDCTFVYMNYKQLQSWQNSIIPGYDQMVKDHNLMTVFKWAITGREKCICISWIF